MDYWIDISSRTEEPFTYRYSYTYEDLSIRDCFGDTEEWYKQTERKIEQGLLEWFIFRVECLVNGVVLGADYLGGNLYDSIDDAMREKFDGYLTDMEETARIQAILKLHEFADIVKERE